VYEKLLAQAVLPAPVQVCGIALRPYSLGHELWLIRRDNPLALFSFSAEVQILGKHLLEAVLFCSQPFGEITDKEIPDKEIDLPAEFKTFREYQLAGSLELPCQLPASRPDDQPSRYLGAPFLLRLHLFLVKEMNLTDEAAWNHPLGFAKMRYAAWMEENQRMEIKNEQDMQVDADRAKWMAEHPGDGIEILETKEASDA
jgi:hypothetical protein